MANSTISSARSAALVAAAALFLVACEAGDEPTPPPAPPLEMELGVYVGHFDDLADAIGGCELVSMERWQPEEVRLELMVEEGVVQFRSLDPGVFYETETPTPLVPTNGENNLYGATLDVTCPEVAEGCGCDWLGIVMYEFQRNPHGLTFAARTWLGSDLATADEGCMTGDVLGEVPCGSVARWVIARDVD